MLSSRWRTRSAIAAGAIALSVGVAACGSSSSSDTSSSSSSSNTTASGSSSAIVAEAQKAVDAAKKGVPSTYQGPTDKVTVPKGITLAVMPCGAAVAGCVALTDAAAALGKQLGWTVKQFDGKANPSDQNAGIQQAIAAGAKVILTGGTDPGAIKSGLAAAKAKGIVVGSMSQGTSAGPGKYDFDINPAGPQMGVAAGNWMIADSNGKAVFQPWIDKEFAGAVQYLEGNVARVKECTTCKVLPEQQFVAASLATTLGSRTVDQARQNPDITYMNPSYDPAAATQAAALLTAGIKTVKVAGLNGQEQNLQLVKDGKVQALDIGYDQEYVGWMGVYQAIRLLDKMPLWKSAGDPVHVNSGEVPWQMFTQDNVPSPITQFSSSSFLDWKGPMGATMGLTEK